MGLQSVNEALVHNLTEWQQSNASLQSAVEEIMVNGHGAVAQLPKIEPVSESNGGEIDEMKTLEETKSEIEKKIADFESANRELEDNLAKLKERNCQLVEEKDRANEAIGILEG